MPIARRDPLLAAAKALTDGREIDWDSLESCVGGGTERVSQFKILLSISKACSSPLEVSPGRDSERGQGSALGRWGSLEVHEKVGSGGFGDVYRAFDTILHREVALKLRRMLGGAADAAFESHLGEARRLARVRHPNVLTVYGVEIHDGRAGMWTDFIRGNSLEQRLAAEGPLPADELARIGLDLCAALAAVHDVGIVHGDVKTANAMIDSGGRTILMDFGAGAAMDSSKAGQAVSPQATPLAMAPEFLRGGPPSQATDLYALGVLLYRLATGMYPIRASDWADLLEQHEHGHRMPVQEVRPDLPAPILLLIEQCLSKDPAARPSSAREAGNFLRAAVVPSAGDDSALRREGHRSLPAFSTRLVGRDQELHELRGLLISRGLVTLVGTGGCGKTRLAHRLAEELAGTLRHGVVWMDLSGLQDGDLLPQGILRNLGLKEEPKRPAVEQLIEHIATRDLLLVLDNCEHITGAVASLAERMLERSSPMRILVTSREPLGLPCERVYRVPPLPTPSGPPGTEGLEILDAESVRLFVDRACLQRPGFSVTPRNAPAIAAIARRVDGIPMAIELAAARIGVLTPEQIADRLDEGFRLLSGSSQGLAPRHSTLLASIDWSFRLLDLREQRCLAMAAVFAGGFTLEAAELVCTDDSAGAPPVLDLLESLVRRSMVQFDPIPPTPRYRLLEMIRSFGVERLRADGMEDLARDRHLSWILALASDLESKIETQEQSAVLEILDAELDNVRLALSWSIHRTPTGTLGRDSGLRLCLSLRRYWFLRGAYREGSQRFSEHMSAVAVGDPLRGRALVAAATLLWPIGELGRAWDMGQQGLALLRESGESSWIASSLRTLGFLAELRGEVDSARSLLTESYALHETLGHSAGMAAIASNLGVLETRLGRHAESIPHYEDAIARLRESGDEPGAAVNMRNMSHSLLQMGNMEKARRLAEASVAALRRVGQSRQLAVSLSALAEVALAENRLEDARRHGLEGVYLARGAGDRVALLVVITTLGSAALALGFDADATRLFGAAEALHASFEIPIGEGEQEAWKARLATLRARFGTQAFDRAWAEGRALSLDGVVAAAEHWSVSHDPETNGA